MKTTNNKKGFLRNSFAALFVLLAVVSGITTGCGKKKSNATAAVVNPGIYPGCVNCVLPNSQFLLSGIGRHYSGYTAVPTMELALEFFGDATSMSYYNTMGYSAFDLSRAYRGQVVAQGYLDVLVNSEPNLCPMYVGRYTVRTVRAGGWGPGNSSFGGLVLEATGPGRIVIQLPNNFVSESIPPMVGRDGRSYPFHVQNMMYIDATVDGRACGGFMLE